MRRKFNLREFIQMPFLHEEGKQACRGSLTARLNAKYERTVTCAEC